MKAIIFTQEGKEKGKLDLPANIFAVKVSQNLLHEADIRYLANKRKNIAKVKTRSDVRGGGRKPWRQKGTGRARQGSIRSPQWRGGGVVFGPCGEENYSKNMPKKMRRKALFGALSEKAQKGEIMILEKFTIEKPKTKTFVQLLEKLPIKRNVLLILPQKDLNIEKSTANLKNVHTLLVNFLSVHEILKYEQVLFIKEAFDKVEEIFAKK